MQRHLADGDIPLNVRYMMDRNVNLVGFLVVHEREGREFAGQPAFSPIPRRATPLLPGIKSMKPSPASERVTSAPIM